MNLSKNKNQYGELITIEQACELSNLGKTKIRKLASDARAVVKIGKSYRIKREILFNHIEETYSI